MKTYRVQIQVRYKDGILDPQAEAITTALRKLGFESIKNLSCDKVFVVGIEAASEKAALDLGRQMAQKLLVNLVMENFDVQVLSA